MFLYVYFKALYSYIFQRKTTLLTTCLVMLSIPAHAQNIDNSRLCRTYEQKLCAIDYQTRMTTQQAKRYHQLSLIQQQANSDARRYSCNPGPFSNGSASEACSYIRASLHRIESALQQIARAAATPQQRHLRQAIYTDMRRYNCRSPQELERLMKENRPATTKRKRIKQTKKPKTVKQAALQQPPACVPAKSINSATDPRPVKATASVGKSPFSIPAAPVMKHKKAAEKSPPPACEAVDYVPNPAIRRVGPMYVPAQ